MKTVLFVIVTTISLAACAGSIGSGEGDSCGGSSDQCGSNLTCQPIKHSDGSTGNYCCPTPNWSSTKSACQGTSH
jgi:hypothetical protein